MQFTLSADDFTDFQPQVMVASDSATQRRLMLVTTLVPLSCRLVLEVNGQAVGSYENLSDAIAAFNAA